MKVAIGSDHAGYKLKDELKELLTEYSYEVTDLGPDSEESVDYPEYAQATAELVANGDVDRGVIVCGSGVGVAIVANKVNGVRAVNAHNSEEAEMARRHNDANVVTLAGRTLSIDDAEKIVGTFFSTEFEGGRHQRRVDQITEVES